MSFELNPELEHFACRFLENRGAVVEKRYGRLEALLSEELSTLLKVPEHIRIHKDAGDEGADMYTVNYGSPLLEKMVDAACASVPVSFCRLEFDYIKSQGFDRLVHEQFSFPASVGRVMRHARVLTEYLLVTCRYLAQSDEQKGGDFQFVFNLETGARVPEMAEMLHQMHRDCSVGQDAVPWEAERVKTVMAWIGQQAQGFIQQEIRPFLESMTRRFRRDAASLEEYYQNLQTEMARSLDRSGLSEQLRRDRKEKIAWLPAELAQKKDDLFKKYSVKVKIEPCAAMIIRTQAVKLSYRASIGRQTKSFFLLYNPVTKAVDPIVCQGCGKNTTVVHFCDRLHMNCPACKNKCPVC